MKKAIIVDLDGILCNIEHRRKYVDGSLGKKDWDKFYEGIPDDEVNDWCMTLIRAMDDYENEHMTIIFVTGRPDNYKFQTEQWLCSNTGYIGNRLYMRKEGDFRKDSIVKKEIYEEHIKDKYEILFCLDDRQQVVDMWREQGLVCLQCDKGDF